MPVLLRISKCWFPLIIIASLLNCKSPADQVDDSDDINALKATITVENLAEGIVLDDPVTSKITINYPKYTKRITVKFDDNLADTTFTSSRPESSENETFFVTRTYITTGNKRITVQIERSDDSIVTYYSDEFVIKDKQVTVEFLSFHERLLIPIDEFDTLVFRAKVNSSKGGIVFKCASLPVLDPEHLKIMTIENTAIVSVKVQEHIEYKVFCYAKSAKAYDTAAVILIPYTKPDGFLDAGKEITVGITDTLDFARNTSSSDILAFSLLNSEDYDPKVMRILSTSSDSLKIEFKPDSAKIWEFSIEITKNGLSDTVTFQKDVTTPKEWVWKQQSTTLNTQEGKTVRHEFGSYLNNTSLAGLSFTVSKGTIEGKSLTYSVPWGLDKDSITIWANSNGTTSSFKLLLNITSGDSSKPLILSEQKGEVVTAQVICTFIITDVGAGIGNVSYEVTNASVNSQSHKDSLYQCIIGNLKHGQPATLTATASDSSIRKNSTSLSITLLRDTTLQDNDAPAITHISGPKSDERVTRDTETIRVSVEDVSGVSGVTATLNGATISGLTNDGSIYSIPLRFITYGKNNVVITATDNTERRNSGSHVLTYVYNTIPSEITVSSPDNEAREVDTLPTFEWTGGDDDDIDLVYFRVEYATSSDLSNSTLSAEVSTNGLTIRSGNGLSCNTRYYYRVVGYTKSPYRDTIRSEIRSFYTGKCEVTKSWIMTGATLTDPDGNIYTMVTIGTQVWTVENLKTTMYNDGVTIPLVTDSTAWAGLSAPGYCWYKNSTDSVQRQKWGALYNWYAVNNGKLAPVGWRVPTDDDWNTLTTYLGGTSVAGGKLKEEGTENWLSPNTGATNISGFSALPGGNRSSVGIFDQQRSNGHWWSATERNGSFAYRRSLLSSSAYLGRYDDLKKYGFSVRLVREETVTSE